MIATAPRAIASNSARPVPALARMAIVCRVAEASIARAAGSCGLCNSPLSRAARMRASRTIADRSLPAGTLTYAGVVFRVSGERLVLHTREGGDQSILLRKDTRFLENGESVEAETLKPNMRVFVRAGKDLYDQVEAYQVIWGSILDPK